MRLPNARQPKARGDDDIKANFARRWDSSYAAIHDCRKLHARLCARQLLHGLGNYLLRMDSDAGPEAVKTLSKIAKVWRGIAAG